MRLFFFKCFTIEPDIPHDCSTSKVKAKHGRIDYCMSIIDEEIIEKNLIILMCVNQ